MEEKHIFLMDYQNRFRFLVSHLGFGTPLIEDAPLYVSLVYPHTSFAVVFYFDVRELSVMCYLYPWLNGRLGRFEQRVIVERVLEEVGVISQQAARERTISTKSNDKVGDAQIIELWRKRTTLWKAIWKSVSRVSLDREQELSEQFMRLEAEYYEYVWRTYGTKIVEWAHRLWFNDG